MNAMVKRSRLSIYGITLITTVAFVLIAASFLVTFYLMAGHDGAELSQQVDEPLEPITVMPDSNKDSSQPPETVNDSHADGLFYKDGILVVNKKHGLPADYSPSENPEAVAHLKELIAAGQANGIDLIYSWSGFRSYSTQAQLYNSYVAQDGVAVADTYSARPGFSEHQTGLAFDLKDHTGNLYRIGDSSYDPTSDWVALNAHQYGFIVRYFDSTQGITGYVGEPWHLRYLGVDLAAKVYQSNLTLEEYLDVPGGDYNG